MRRRQEGAPGQACAEEVECAQRVARLPARLHGREAQRTNGKDAVSSQLALRHHHAVLREQPVGGGRGGEVHGTGARGILQPEAAVLQLREAAEHEARLAGGAQQRLQRRQLAEGGGLLAGTGRGGALL
jgi:hypothetical protein